jgi:hypothetical protein
MTFDTEILNIVVVGTALQKKGLKLVWVARQLGLNRSAGYMMFRHGILPLDLSKRAKVVGKLSEIVGLPVSQILVRLPEAKTA